MQILLGPRPLNRIVRNPFSHAAPPRLIATVDPQRATQLNPKFFIPMENKILLDSLHKPPVFTLLTSPAHRYDNGRWKPLVMDFTVYEKVHDSGGIILISEWDFQKLIEEYGEIPPIEINLFPGDPEVDLSKVRVQLEGDYLGAKVAFEPVSDDEWTEFDSVRQGTAPEQSEGKIVALTPGHAASPIEKKAA